MRWQAAIERFLAAVLPTHVVRRRAADIVACQAGRAGHSAAGGAASTQQERAAGSWRSRPVAYQVAAAGRSCTSDQASGGINGHALRCPDDPMVIRIGEAKEGAELVSITQRHRGYGCPHQDPVVRRRQGTACRAYGDDFGACVDPDGTRIAWIDQREWWAERSCAVGDEDCMIRPAKANGYGSRLLRTVAGTLSDGRCVNEYKADRQEREQEHSALEKRA